MTQPSDVRTVGFLRGLDRPVFVPEGAIVNITREQLEDLRARGGERWLCDLTLTPVAVGMSIAFRISRLTPQKESAVMMVPCPACKDIPPSKGFTLCEVCGDNKRVVVEMAITQAMVAPHWERFRAMCREWAADHARR